MMSKNLDDFIQNQNDKILSLWKESESSIIAYNKNEAKDRKNKKAKQRIIDNKIPSLIAKLPDKCEILFIGLNPSFNVRGIIQMLTKPEYNKIISNEIQDKITEDEIKNLFKYNSDDFNKGNSKHEKIIEYEKAAHAEYPYFDKFKDLAKAYLDNHEIEYWAHIDWLYLRETSSSNIEIYLKSPELKDFFERQIGITVEIIKKLNPKVILVANALASKIFKQQFILKELPIKVSKESEDKIYDFLVKNAMNYDEGALHKINEIEGFKINKNFRDKIWRDYVTSFKFDDKIGTYKLKLDERKEELCNVFFSGMISGQRALDLDTFKRLEWHLKKIKNVM